MLRPWQLDIRLDQQNEKAIYVQIADAIISDIQSGRLKTGEALPGSRLMAEMLKVNRNTVVEALNLLLNEEWIVSKERKGTFVADILPGDWSTPKKLHSLQKKHFIKNTGSASTTGIPIAR
ncbi:GntR family transcriptional regulator [Niabella hibiscisoli]|uniref:GntR family transcriptional regulator n=1 Tax=Niabella hibiscisoli TaxID=1825928 RepID=UPI001F11544A|nr:winged helix-turn-helix domain-containing protein [Niabella hibiscisoli]MCH5718236.1 winged helix-turn-helix domain-containing protein [Niabella hibiscisoli]